jgi:hypothetical protein
MGSRWEGQGYKLSEQQKPRKGVVATSGCAGCVELLDHGGRLCSYSIMGTGWHVPIAFQKLVGTPAAAVLVLLHV